MSQGWRSPLGGGSRRDRLSPGAWVWPTGLRCDLCGLSHRIRWNCPGSDRRDTAGRHSGGQTQGRAWGPASWRGAWESPSRPAPGAVGLQAWGARIENRCPRGAEARHGRDPARRHEGVGSRLLPRQLPPLRPGWAVGVHALQKPAGCCGGWGGTLGPPALGASTLLALRSGQRC